MDLIGFGPALRSRRLTLSRVAGFLVLFSGCGEDLTITGKVTIPVEVQQLFSKEQPGNVEVMPSKGGGAVALRFLCEPSSEPLVLEYRIYDETCAVEQAVEARAYRVKPDFLFGVRCGEKGGSSGGGKGEELAYASAPVFVGQTGCESGEATVDLTLAIK